MTRSSRGRSRSLSTVRPLSRPFLAPHFVELLRKSLPEAERDAAVVSTLDLELQRDAEGLVRTHLAAIEDRARATRR